MASIKTDPRVLHSSITQICVPDTLAYTSSRIQLNTKLLKLEQHIRNITSLETFWSAKRPVVTAFDSGRPPTAQMFPARNLIEPLPMGIEHDVHANSKSSSLHSSPVKECLMPAQFSKAEWLSDAPLSTQILHVTNTQPFFCSMDQPTGSSRKLDKLSREELLAYLDTMPFAKAMIEQKLAKEPAKAAIIPTAPLLLSGLVDESPTTMASDSSSLFETEVEIRVAEARRQLRKTTEREHRTAADKIEQAFRKRMEEAIAKHKAFIAKISTTPVPAGHVRVQTNKHGIIQITDREATRLICENDIIGKAYKDLCMQVLHKYKGKIRDEYIAVLRNLEADPDLNVRGRNRLKRLHGFLPPTPVVPLDPSLVLVENRNPNMITLPAGLGNAYMPGGAGRLAGRKRERILSIERYGMHGAQYDDGPHGGVLQPKRMRMDWENMQAKVEPSE